VLAAEQADPHAPIKVWFHGGAWQFGAPERLCAFGEFFYQRGYTVYMPSHRRLPRFGGTTVLADAWAALKLLQQRVSTPPQLFLGGMSSGGHLATLALLRQREWLGAGRIHGLLACGAPLSLGHLASSPSRRRFAGRPNSWIDNGLDPATLLRQSASSLDSSLLVNALILHGTRDGLVPWESAAAFVNEARRLKWSALKFHCIPNGGHLDAARWVWPATTQ